MEIKTIEYQGWKNCLHLSNGTIDLIITTDVGPRVIRCGFVGQDNLFKEYPETLGATGGEEWNIFGGHRLWHSPEEKPRTYWPDNVPVQWEPISGGVHLKQNVETTTGIAKEIQIRLHESEAKVEVTHTLRNTYMWSIELAPWALSVMNTGGTAIMPLPSRDTHENSLLPTSTIALWPYTNMTDPRWHWGEKYLLLRQDERATTPQKIGVHVSSGWAAYARAGQLFLKTFGFQAGVNYPDFESTVEVFTNHDMLELETLGPLTKLGPGGAVEHTETWHLFDGDIPIPLGDGDVENHILPHIKSLI
jgi:hypothetical protein